MKFQNPQNNIVEESSAPWLWTFCFGCLYFALKGIWTHFAIGLILAFMTGGFSWLVYPFFANGIVRKHYQDKGWVEVP